MTWSATAESRSGRCARQSRPCGYSSLTSCKRTDWHRRPTGAVVGEQGRTNPLAALEELRRRIRTRHYSYRTERTYADWVRRFFTYLAGRQGAPHPRLDSDAVRDYLTHLAVRQRVSASSQNQALSAILFLCREVLGVEVEDVSATVRAKPRDASAGRTEHAGDRKVAGRPAGEDLADGRADLRGRVASLGVLPATREGHRLRSRPGLRSEW